MKTSVRKRVCAWRVLSGAGVAPRTRGSRDAPVVVCPRLFEDSVSSNRTNRSKRSPVERTTLSEYLRYAWYRYRELLLYTMPRDKIKGFSNERSTYCSRERILFVRDFIFWRGKIYFGLIISSRIWLIINNCMWSHENLLIRNCFARKTSFSGRIWKILSTTSRTRRNR